MDVQSNILDLVTKQSLYKEITEENKTGYN